MTLRKQIAEIDAALSDQIVDKWDYRKMIYYELEDIKARLDKLEESFDKQEVFEQDNKEEIVCDIVDGMIEVLEALEKL